MCACVCAYMVCIHVCVHGVCVCVCVCVCVRACEYNVPEARSRGMAHRSVGQGTVYSPWAVSPTRTSAASSTPSCWSTETSGSLSLPDSRGSAKQIERNDSFQSHYARTVQSKIPDRRWPEWSTFCIVRTWPREGLWCRQSQG